jgi:integrase
MKHKIRFLLKNPNAKKISAILMIVSWGYRDKSGKYKNLKYSTGQSVNPDKWDKKIYQAKGKYSSGVNNELDNIKYKVNKIFNKLEGEVITPDVLKTELDILMDRVKVVSKPKHKKTTIRSYLATYIANMESGKRRTFRDPLKKVSLSTIKNLKSFGLKLGDYEKATGKAYAFNDIDMKFYTQFVMWLGERHAPNSVGKTIKQLKTVMQAALDDDIHSNVAFKKKTFKVTSVLEDKLALTDDDLNLLYKTNNLPEQLEKARDLFLIGCFTLQRVSDWHKINKENLRTLSDGTKAFEFAQKKTGTKVLIPMLDPRLEAIMTKYNFNPPMMPHQKINNYIKFVCRKAGLEDKADRVTTHTARRTGCTIWYKEEIPMSDIMAVSGHKTETEFRKYIRMEKEEAAIRISKHKYFTSRKA